MLRSSSLEGVRGNSYDSCGEAPLADALWRFGSGIGDSFPKLRTGGIPGTSNPQSRARFAGAALDAGCDFDGSDIAAAESAWPEAAP